MHLEIDHVVSVGVFLVVILLVTGQVCDRLEMARLYDEKKQVTATLNRVLDYLLLNPGVPADWGTSDSAPTFFGLQDPEGTNYWLSGWSVARLATPESIYYPKTGKFYGNVGINEKCAWHLAVSSQVNYSTVMDLLGLRGDYDMYISIRPAVTVSVNKTQDNPLTFSVKVTSEGGVLSNIAVCFSLIESHRGAVYPTIVISYGVGVTDEKGEASTVFSVDGSELDYALIVYTPSLGLEGRGVFIHSTDDENYPVPLVESISNGEVILAHSQDINYVGMPRTIKYRAAFYLVSSDYTLRPLLEEITGSLQPGGSFGELTIPAHSPGILVVAYQTSAVGGGVVLMPWGLTQLGFETAFGVSASDKIWSATDMRYAQSENGVSCIVQMTMWRVG